MIRFIKHNDNINYTEYSIGGKARNLLDMSKKGFNIPPYLVIPYEVLFKFLPHNGNPETDIPSIPDNYIQQITKTLPKCSFYAVRSSAVGEDSQDSSYAGQFYTALYVDKQHLAEKIIQVWKSIYTERVKVYTKKNNNEPITQIAVIVQVMIDAEVSGVAFSINPITGNRKQTVVNAVYGVGEGLVSGQLNADSYVIENENIEIDIASKSSKLIYQKEEKELKLVDVDNDLQNKAVLKKEQLLYIQKVLQDIENQTKTYSEIEFSYHNNQFYLLQTRPVTTSSNLPDASGKYIVWDNSNIIESYPGVTTPLTFSFIIDIYNTAYRQLLALFGVSDAEIDENSDYFANMLGFLRNRVYYNLRSWYKLLSVLPGYSINAGFMEKMMGVKERFELDDVKKRSKFVDYMRIVKMVFHLIQNLRSVVKQKDAFEKNFEKVQKQFDDKMQNRLNANDLYRLFQYLEVNLLQRWKAPLVNDFFAMIYFGLLQKMASKYSGSEHLHNDLLSGSNDIISTEPARRTQQIAATIRTNNELMQLFENENTDEIYSSLKQKKYEELKQEIDNYIQQFGDRFTGELKLETITFTQNPKLFIKVLKGYLHGKKLYSFGSQSGVRTQAEQIINKKLKGKWLKRWIFRHILKKARYLISNRENLRYYRTKAFGMVRNIFTLIGIILKKENAIDNERDVFYLTKTEIFDFIKGTSVQVNLKQIIEIRKNEYQKHAKEQVTANRIKTRGMVYMANDFYIQDENGVTDGNLSGIGCSRGVVKAKVRVVKKPDEVKSLNGDIMVAATTDPGWITLFPSAGGIIVERGSLLSHSAIVSREMGIPCIVAVNNLLTILKTGDLIEMDGSTGMIKILNQ